MLRRRHQFFVSLLSLTDAGVITLAAMAAWIARRELSEGFYPLAWEEWVKQPLLIFVVPIGLLCLRASGLYRPRRDRTLLSEVFGVVRAGVLTIAATVFALWAVGNDALSNSSTFPLVTVLGQDLAGSRFQILLLGPLLILCLSMYRVMFRLSLRAIRARGWNQRHVLVVGTGRLAQVAVRTITRNSWTGMRVSGFVAHHDMIRRRDPQRKRMIGDVEVLGGLGDLDRILDETDYDVVYLALPGRVSDRMPDLLRLLDRHAIDVRVIPDVPARYLTQTMAVSELDGMPVLSYRESPVAGIGGMTKRFVDIAGGSLAMVLFAPLMLAIAGLIALTSSGPVIFRQRRVSIGGEEFNLYKFRTMVHAEEEAKLAWTSRDDPRITPLGAFLRRTSLDELPQLLNVLRGEMSLVGPRPERPELIARFRDDWRGYMIRQHVKAGMTGWAQVNGLRGDTSLRKRLQYDLFYIKNWSVLFDIRILLLTVVRGFVHRNAH